MLSSCSQVNVPGARNASIPSPTMADKRPEAVNESPDSVLYLPLGSDVLVPEVEAGFSLPKEYVGPFELRSETLAGALQLILADYEIPLAFETDEGLTRTITVANLRGSLDRIVNRVCSLADLYCAFEDGILVIKETQIFTVTIPPVGGDTDILSAMATGIEAITGHAPITDSGTRTIIYEATNRTAKLAERYFQRVRSNTALIVFEVYIWEVGLDTDNATGIDWEQINAIGKFVGGVTIPGGTSADYTPISIGLPTINGEVSFDGNDVFEFISNYGAVKTISQPQITVLSGASATLRAADTRNYVSSLSRSVDNGEVTVSTETDSVDTGFTLTISSAWDNATVYGTIEIQLQEFRRFVPFDADGTQLQLPETTERELSTQIRMRPGDSLLIAGLVRENDQFDKSGPGFNSPLFPTSRSSTVSNTELVFLLKPRVIVYTAEGGNVGVKSEPDTDDEDIPYIQARDRKEEFPFGSISENMLNPAL
ncbi:MAG: type II and III secretion system family protein [Alphaproteobacteria bacterium]|nr:type II and III secretion system family protein [Alphaproteobacteria bacterium]